MLDVKLKKEGTYRVVLPSSSGVDVLPAGFVSLRCRGLGTWCYEPVRLPPRACGISRPDVESQDMLLAACMLELCHHDAHGSLSCPKTRLH